MESHIRSSAHRISDGVGAKEDELAFPFEALEPIDEVTRSALEGAALHANDRYLHELIEEFSFCPFAREGRRAGTTERHVHYADSLDPVPLFELMRDISSRPGILVAQCVCRPIVIT